MSDQLREGPDEHSGRRARDGLGIEVTSTVVRGVRLTNDSAARLAHAAEFPIVAHDLGSTLDALILLRAELDEVDGPTRIATFPRDTVMQRIDITGRSNNEIDRLRSSVRDSDDAASTWIADDGPRRWLSAIRWNEPFIDRLIALAVRAGFHDIAVEPSAVAMARISPPDATYVRRLVAQGEAFHAVISNRLPVVALPTAVRGRAHPDVDVAAPPVSLAMFDDRLDEAELAASLDRIATRADDDRAGPRELGALSGWETDTYPDHDVRSAKRQFVAIGAAIGASGRAGPISALHRIDRRDHRLSVADPADRPWAIEELQPTAPSSTSDPSARRGRWFRSRQSRSKIDGR